MIEKIIGYVSGFFAIVLGFMSLFIFAKNKGIKEEQQKNIEQTLKVVNEAKKESNAVDRLSNTDTREQLREFTRN